MQVVSDFNDYKLIEMSNGYKKEVWKDFTLVRPDPQIVWEDKLSDKYDAKYIRKDTGGGSWDIKNNKLLKSWQIKYHDLTFNLKLMGFKHTGVFPEQAYNWNYLIDTIKNSNRKDIKVLNLFAYTGGATLACLYAGASVVHVDSSKGMVDWAKENVKSSNLEDRPVRFIVDDVVKFVKREIRRGNKYDIIIMDPPSFGRGSKGEVWNFERDFYNLVLLCEQLLSEEPVMFLVNSYTTGISMTIIKNILELRLKNKYQGQITCDELGLQCSNGLILPCGMFARWTK